MKTITGFLRFSLFAFFLLQLSCAGNPGKEAAQVLGWEVGFQAYTFNRFTLAEALAKGDSIGLKSVEAYPGQEIGGGIEGTTLFTMDQATRDKVKELLAAREMKLNAYGVAGPEDSAEWKQLFDFAKDMGIGVITAEPRFDQLDLVAQLCDEYGIKVAIHNHPSPSLYWNPDTVLEALDGRTANLGVCADIGHWIRSGLDPIECLKKLEGRIIILHFKDLNEKAPEAHDVPWGTGVANVPAVLAELKRQGFRGLFDIEYEHNWDNSGPEVKQCVDNFYKMVAEL
jgi:sugar phosphate isomerase/epimerase